MAKKATPKKTAAKQPEASPDQRFRVRATQNGQIHGGQKHPGDEFLVTEQQFSARWMERVE